MESQEIEDTAAGLALTTSFVKSGSQGSHGGDWVARVEGTALKKKGAAKEISLFFYAGFIDDSEAYMDDEDLLESEERGFIHRKLSNRRGRAGRGFKN